MKIMGTGSRSMIVHPDRVKIYQNLETHVLKIWEDDPDLELISGMAEGWDEAIAKVGMRNGIPYTVIIPSKDYGSYYWGSHSLTGKNRLKTYNELLVGASDVVFLEDLFGKPKMLSRNVTGIGGPHYMVDGAWQHANFARNIVMVKRADKALVYDANSPGTKHCVKLLVAHKIPYEVSPF